MGQGEIGLENKDYYKTETPVTAAYRQFMRDLAKALATDASMIDQDVTDIYEFERNIAQVPYRTLDRQQMIDWRRMRSEPLCLSIVPLDCF